MTGTPAATGRGADAGRPGLIGRRDLVALLDQAAAKQVTIISAPAGSGKTSLLRAWADRPGQDRPIAFLSVRPGQHDDQLFWLTLLGAIRAAAGGSPSPPAAPGFDGQAMVDKVLDELASRGPSVLIIDDLHELSSAAARKQLVKFFEAMGPTDPLTLSARRRLSSLMFS